jgi:DNA-binding transcriptional ArsR family regulator
VKIACILAISPRLELFFAFAAVLEDGAGDRQPDGTRRWLDQARRRLDHSFGRRLGDLVDPDLWRRLAALPLSREAALSADVDGVIEAVAALPPESFAPAPDPEARQRLVVDALRRFDRLAFASYWRPWREELTDLGDGLEAGVRALAVDARGKAALFLPSRFASPGFTARIPADDTIILAFDPDRLPARPSAVASAPTSSAMPRRASAALDPARIFRALGDATRYTIAGLIAREPMTSAELARRLDISKPTMAHHLRSLRAAGLVTEEVRGTRIMLMLDRAMVESLSEAAVSELFGASAAAPIRRSRRA